MPDTPTYPTTLPGVLARSGLRGDSIGAAVVPRAEDHLDETLHLVGGVALSSDDEELRCTDSYYFHWWYRGGPGRVVWFLGDADMREVGEAMNRIIQCDAHTAKKLERVWFRGYEPTDEVKPILKWSSRENRWCSTPAGDDLQSSLETQDDIALVVLDPVDRFVRGFDPANRVEQEARLIERLGQLGRETGTYIMAFTR